MTPYWRFVCGALHSKIITMLTCMATVELTSNMPLPQDEEDRKHWWIEPVAIYCMVLIIINVVYLLDYE